jgi:hypothetical protein
VPELEVGNPTVEPGQDPRPHVGWDPTHQGEPVRSHHLGPDERTDRHAGQAELVIEVDVDAGIVEKDPGIGGRQTQPGIRARPRASAASSAVMPRRSGPTHPNGMNSQRSRSAPAFGTRSSIHVSNSTSGIVIP